MATAKKSELSVILKTKDLVNYILTITEKSPKKFRFTMTGRIINLSIEALENLYRANEMQMFLEDATIQKDNQRQRRKYQEEALMNIKLVAFMAEIGSEHKAILPKQYEQISIKTAECQRLIGGWMKSDEKRILSQKV